MKVASVRTAFVGRHVWKARRVVRPRTALQIRCAGHCAAANKAVSYVYQCTAVYHTTTLYCCVLSNVQYISTARGLNWATLLYGLGGGVRSVKENRGLVYEKSVSSNFNIS